MVCGVFQSQVFTSHHNIDQSIIYCVRSCCDLYSSCEQWCQVVCSCCNAFLKLFACDARLSRLHFIACVLHGNIRLVYSGVIAVSHTDYFLDRWNIGFDWWLWIASRSNEYIVHSSIMKDHAINVTSTLACLCRASWRSVSILLYKII